MKDHQRKRPSSIVVKVKNEESNKINFPNQQFSQQTSQPSEKRKDVLMREVSQVSGNLSPSSPTKKKSKQSAFLTQKRQGQVELAFNELTEYIGEMDKKISGVIERSEAEFLIAYRNHNKRIREEIEEIKKKTVTNANSSLSQTQKIQTLQKQLTLFREQSLRLFEQMTEKEHTISNLQKRVEQLVGENKKYEHTIKELMRTNKLLEAKNVTSNSQYNPDDATVKEFKLSHPLDLGIKTATRKSFTQDIMIRPNTTSGKVPYIRHKNSVPVSYGSRQMRQSRQSLLDDPNQLLEKINQTISILTVAFSETKNQSKLNNQQLFNNYSKKLKEEIETVFKSHSNKRNESFTIRDISTRNQKRTHSSANRPFSKASKAFDKNNSTVYAQRSELQSYFHKSIEIVRKQIVRRRGLKSSNFYNQHASLTLEEFKKVDFFRLLQLLFSNEKILQVLHNAIFEQSHRIYN